MQVLRITIIDVGWGDSLLLETQDDADPSHYALVDANDTSTLRSSHIFLKRFFERKGFQIPSTKPVFDWILISHAHADHGQGLKRIMQDYGTLQFWYPKTKSQAAFFTDLLHYAQTSKRVSHHQAIDDTKLLPPFGSAQMRVLWPPWGQIDQNENNNSVVLTVTLGNVAFVLTGDSEADVWTKIAAKLPARALVFKVPHHGSANGMFDSSSQTPWLNKIGVGSRLVISSHILPFQHPSPSVIQRLNQSGLQYYRTDEHYHVTFDTDGNQILVKYSH